jgi:hypothetical protein
MVWTAPSLPVLKSGEVVGTDGVETLVGVKVEEGGADTDTAEGDEALWRWVSTSPRRTRQVHTMRVAGTARLVRMRMRQRPRPRQSQIGRFFEIVKVIITRDKEKRTTSHPSGRRWGWWGASRRVNQVNPAEWAE